MAYPSLAAPEPLRKGSGKTIKSLALLGAPIRSFHFNLMMSHEDLQLVLITSGKLIAKTVVKMDNHFCLIGFIL